MTGLPVPSTPAGRAALAAVLAAPAAVLVALDYDGTLAPIVDEPEQAVAHAGAADALAALAARVGRVALVTGRPATDAVRLGRLSGVDGLVVLGHYGLERWSAGRLTTPEPHPGVATARAAAARLVAGAPAGVALEDKGHSVAVHTRQAADPDAALVSLTVRVQELAERAGLEVAPGRYVLELRPHGTDKGAAVRALVAETSARAVVYAGDDMGDLAAVAALRELPVTALVVCSDSAESPQALRDAADLVVDGPAGVVRFLADLARALPP
ncbi:MAG: trehalose-phosphatase [Jiangellaceae bacterium]